MLVKFAHRHRRWLRFLWALAILVVVVGSLLPASSLPMRALDELGLSDKLEHFAAYLVLAFLPALHERWPALAAALGGALALGIGLEYAQLLSPGRSFDLADMLADAVGVLCGFVIALPLRA